MVGSPRAPAHNELSKGRVTPGRRLPLPLCRSLNGVPGLLKGHKMLRQPVDFPNRPEELDVFRTLVTGLRVKNKVLVHTWAVRYTKGVAITSKLVMAPFVIARENTLCDRHGNLKRDTCTKGEKDHTAQQPKWARHSTGPSLPNHWLLRT